MLSPDELSKLKLGWDYNISEQLCADAANEIDALRERVKALEDAAEEVPDPQEDGFCESCNDYPMPLVKVGEAYKWDHKANCWYGRLQDVLTAARGGCSVGARETAEMSE